MPLFQVRFQNLEHARYGTNILLLVRSYLAVGHVHGLNGNPRVKVSGRVTRGELCKMNFL